MVERGEQRIGWEEAARLIYQTREPTVVQINKVGYKVARGVLKGSVKGSWVALDSVVDYLAARSEQRRMEKTNRAVRRKTAVTVPESALPNHSAAPLKTIPRREQQEFSHLYLQSVHDYFAAVFRRRYPNDATSLFLVSVRVGQIAIVLLPLFVIGYGYATVTAPPPEQTAVERWLEREVGDYQIEKWFPPESRSDGVGKMVRVQYRYYTPSRKVIVTDRIFLVNGETVTLISNAGSD